LQARELAYILRQSRAAGLFLVPEYRGHPMAAILDEIQADIPDLREVILFTDRSGFRTSTKRITPLPQVRADYPAQIQYTSGTTGAPKGAILHHRGLTNNARFIAGRLGARTGDVWGNPNPLFHVSGSGFCNLGAMQSLSVQLLCSFDPALLVALVEQERATLLSLPPTVLDAFLRQAIGKAHDLSSLRAVNTGGMTVPAELVRHAEEVLSVPVLIGYGQTEACGLVLHTALDDSPDDRAETLGRPLPQIAVRIADPQSGATVPLGEIGELCVRGYTVMTGYLDQPEATAAAIDTEGWLHTGDLGTMDTRGYCRIVDRLKDMIIRGGENIYPREIEDLLEQHPAVAAAAVIGMPDGRYGEAVVACIQPAVGHTINERELQTYCRARLAAYKVPQRWIILEELPRTPLGKIQKFALRTLV
jgi:fatty-acyl-CoA synthase